jgi:hypothetical protein
LERVWSTTHHCNFTPTHESMLKRMHEVMNLPIDRDVALAFYVPSEPTRLYFRIPSSELRPYRAMR